MFILISALALQYGDCRGRLDFLPRFRLVCSPARSDWHAHPLTRSLIVMCGLGRTQCEDEPKVEVRPDEAIT